MPLGIRPINDFAFKKTFGTAENRIALISLLNAILRPKSPIVEDTYNVRESELRSASTLDCWLYWLLHAHEYEPAALLKLLPQPAIRQATETLTRIAEITEDKVMYDARERAIQDREWEHDATFLEGKIEGEIKGEIKGETKVRIETIQMLQGLLRAPVSEEHELRTLSLAQLQALTNDLQEKLRNRTPS